MDKKTKQSVILLKYIREWAKEAEVDELSIEFSEHSPGTREIVNVSISWAPSRVKGSWLDALKDLF